MKALVKEYQYFTKKYKKVVFTFIAANRYRRGDMGIIGKDIAAIILMLDPEYDIERIDSGFILVVDYGPFNGWTIMERIMRDYHIHGWRFPKHQELDQRSRQAVIDSYVNERYRGEPPRRIIALQGHPEIFSDNQITKYCITDAHINNMTFVYIAESANEVPVQFREQIQKIYSSITKERVAAELKFSTSRLKDIKSFRIDRIPFTEYHINGEHSEHSE